MCECMVSARGCILLGMEEFLPKEKRGACAACGGAPVSHLETFIMSTFEVWLHDHVHTRPRLRRLCAYVHEMSFRMESPLLRLVHYVSGMRSFTDTSRVSSHRAFVLWEEAKRRGVPMEQIAMFGHPIDCYRMRINGSWIYFEGLPVPRYSASAYAWLDDKFLFKRFLSECGVSAAEAGIATTLDEARSIFQNIGSPVVVKPRRGSRARHTTTHVRMLDDFDAAFLSAKQLCKYVLIEKHLSGKLCRATVVDGELVGFLKKSYPTVLGDGVHTIRELVMRKNADKPERVWDIMLDEDAVSCLKRQGLSFESVPPKDLLVEISQHTGRQVGGDTHEMPTKVHLKLRAHLERVARLLDIQIVGFDLIIPDPELDPDLQTWGILEANSLPFIDLHYLPLYGRPSNVAKNVLDLWIGKEGV